MLGSGDPTPFDMPALGALCALAFVLLIGFVLGPRWISLPATLLRWGALSLAALIVAAVLIVTPTMTGSVGAGRMITLLPAGTTVLVLFLLWSWRLGHL